MSEKLMSLPTDNFILRMYSTTDKRFHRITSTTDLHFCFILAKMSMETIIYILNFGAVSPEITDDYWISVDI